LSIQTLAELIRVVERHDLPNCLVHKVGSAWTPMPARELVGRVRALATTLDAWGIRPGDRVALMADSGVHWPMIDLAAIALGAATVPVYSSLHADGAAYVIRDSGARVLFVQGEERLVGLRGLAGELPAVERWVAIDAPATDGVTALEDALAVEAPAPDATWDEWLGRARPDDLATLIYTSGTTGDPKGVMLTHRNLASNVSTCAEILPMKKHWQALSFLPLAHSLERTVQYVYLHCGVSIAYAESVAKVPENLLELRPHVLASVPRLYEKIHGKVLEGAAQLTGLRRRIFDWSLATGRRAVDRRLRFEAPGWRVRIADKLVFSKLRERLGGRYEYAISGGAPLSREIAEFFWAAGLPILEGYGLTETSPVLAVNTPRHVRLGTVGLPIPGVEIRIAEDGEILARGPNIMRGYFGLEEATAEVLEADGWFHTGDIGALDDDGFLSITDRKKELIVTAYGKNVAPAPIENHLKSSPWVAQVVVVGDRRPFLVALVVPDFERVAVWAREKSVPGGPEEWIADDRLREIVQAEIDRVNEGSERYEQIRRFELLPRELTLDDGELTPTLKVKRRVIHERYAAILERLYEGHDGAT